MKKLNSVINPALIAPFGLKIMRATDVGITIQGEDPEPLTAEDLATPAVDHKFACSLEVDAADVPKLRSFLHEMHRHAVEQHKMMVDGLLLRIDNLVRVQADVAYAGPVLRSVFDGTYVWMDGRSLQRILQVKISVCHDEIQFDMFGPLAKKVREGLNA